MRSRLLASLVLLAAATANVCAQDAPHERKAREVYAHVVGLRTAAGHAQTAKMVDYLAGVLVEGGVPRERLARLEAGGETAMLVKVAGLSKARPILFSAHMDVVDARPEEWTRDPFTLVEENGQFYGRGTMDNKAGVTALVTTILRFAAEGLQPQRTLVFAFVGDEETDMHTTRAIAAHEWVRGAEFAINTDAGGGILEDASGKPLVYLVQGAEKTYATYELTVRNPGGHSSRPRADNAIYELARALGKVEAYRFPVMSNELTRAYLGTVGRAQPGEIGAALTAFSKDPADAAAIEAISRSPEFVGTTRTTCVATKLEGGHAENALPQTAKALVNCRIFPGVEVEAVRAELATAIGNPAVGIETLGTPEASPVSEMRDDVMAAITQEVHARHPGVPVVPYLESGGTDGKIYRKAGIPTYASSGMFAKPSE